jgi:hypothetical protein
MIKLYQWLRDVPTILHTLVVSKDHGDLQTLLTCSFEQIVWRRTISENIGLHRRLLSGLAETRRTLVETDARSWHLDARAGHF